MSTITQRADGRFQATIQVNGVRRYLYGKTKAEVKKKLEAAQRSVFQLGGIPTSGKLTLDDLLGQYIASATLKARTRADYQMWQRVYISPYLGKVPLKNLAPFHLQKLYATLAETRTRVPSQAHALLHRALKMAVLWRLIPINPADGVIRPVHHPRRKDLWTLDQTHAFLEGAKEEDYFPIWKLILYSGCRISEVMALTWADVDWEQSGITVSKNVQRIKREWVVQSPKTKSGYRKLSLPPEVMADLSARQKEQGLVFPTRGGKFTDGRCVQRRLRVVANRLGLPPVTLHELRHLHASILLAHKVPVPEVSARLGHANPQVTMTVYAHALKGTGHLAAQAISEALGR